MKESVFAFLRATFYRWTQVWPEVCPDLVSATTVSATFTLKILEPGATSKAA
jgi:hypothetical protein